MAALLTPRDLELLLDQTIPADRRESAQAACDDAMGQVCGHLRTTPADVESLEEWQVAAIKAVAKGVAADTFGNPLGRATFTGPEGLNFAAPPRTRRTLFDSEKRALDNLFLPGFA